MQARDKSNGMKHSPWNVDSWKGLEKVHENKWAPTHDENKKHRENDLRRFGFAPKISLRVWVVVPPLYLLLVGSNLQENSQVAVKHYEQRNHETRDDYQQNVASALGEGNFTHGVESGVGVLVPTKDWEDANDYGPDPC